MGARGTFAQPPLTMQFVADSSEGRGINFNKVPLSLGNSPLPPSAPRAKNLIGILIMADQ
jgi:hypothetical protein